MRQWHPPGLRLRTVGIVLVLVAVAASVAAVGAWYVETGGSLSNALEYARAAVRPSP